MKRALALIPFLTTLNCGGAPSAEQKSPQIEIHNTPEVAAISRSENSQLIAALKILGGDLCASSETGDIEFKPFHRTKEEIAQAYDVDPLTAKMWQLPGTKKGSDEALKLFSGESKTEPPFCYSSAILYDVFYSSNFKAALKQLLNKKSN